MVKYFIALLVVLGGCNSTKKSSNSSETTSTNQADDNSTRNEYAKTITTKDLKNHLYKIAANDMEGRMTGEPGQKMAAEYLKNYYINQNINAPTGDDNYYQEIPASFFANYFGLKQERKDSENVFAFIEGKEKPEEVIVISAHYDHVGMKNEEVYNGADDDGSGTVAVLEIAEAFQKAVKDGNGPKRSILFLHVTGEEIGLYGSKYYTENPTFPLANTVCNLNIDMIGRIDPNKADTPNYIYLIGSDKLSQELHDLSEEVNETYINLELDYTFNADDDPNRFYYRSDHYNFAKNNIPVIFYFNGVHEDYHQPTDTPDKIEYELLAKRTQLIFQTAWEIANRENRITADKLK